MSAGSEADARFFLIKYMVDPRRREPINVGVAVESADGWALRFLGERTDSTLQPPRWARLKREIYAGWIDYYRRKCQEMDGWRDIERLHARRPGNFYVGEGGYQRVEDDDYSGALDELFRTFVERSPASDDQRKPPVSRLDRQVDRILTFAGIVDNVERDVSVDASYGGRLTQVEFRYRYINGTPHLMDELVGSNPQVLARNARELQARVYAAMDAGSAMNFLTFFSSAAIRGEVPESALYPAEMVSKVIDTDDELQAVEAVRHLVHADA